MAKSFPIDEEFFPPFEGFPAGSIDFFRRLKKHNTREWFLKHKHVYEENLKFPMQRLIATLGRELRDDMPEMEFNPRKAIFRIHRDVRFSPNKAPYKTNIAAAVELKGRKKSTETPGLYVGIEPGSVFVGGGLYMPQGEQLKAIRKAIVDRPDEFLAVVGNARFTKVFGGILGEKLRRAPRGFPDDHPMIQHLKHKQFFVGIEWQDETVCYSKRFARIVADCFRDAAPFVRWLITATSA